ncbi:MAG: hypothetical protein H6557_06380 [Lewinellaceae bacterium]|nr:hypothetical protein [Phaeodactylibacter sp.]MCB9036233.1 hypothetical protein [Lewinellaceae bacterium]
MAACFQGCRASQEGELKWNYYLTTSNGHSTASEVNLFGEEIQEIDGKLKIGTLETRFVALRQ